MNIGLIITAGGSGRRLGAKEGKPFVALNGKPIILYSCEAFQNIPEITQFVITIDSERDAQLQKVLSHYQMQDRFQIVKGGVTRQQSVQNGFEALKKTDYVMVHDAARPMVTLGVIQRVIEGSGAFPCVIPGLPVVDTMKRVENGQVIETVSRDHIYSVQTPQLFQYDRLKTIYEGGENMSVTDEAMLMEKNHIPIHVVPGDRRNIKITYPEDLFIASKCV
ncbi:MAG: 2-C-methyl-D-erythritol 4-phosphate cytidylyltransferase [Candidatus Margulisbacteria bacterium]|nr:2-C-methyl-D-erythritol 4-phosphate cytidylyltransferase [Candidatus Margulisiibacteriota bacterium]